MGGVFSYSDWGHVTMDGNFHNNIMLYKTLSLNTSAFWSIVMQEAAIIGALLQYQVLKQVMLDTIHHAPTTTTKPIMTLV